jgi:hypothetical protein
MRQWALGREREQWDEFGRPANIDPGMTVEEYAAQQWADPRTRERTARLLGWSGEGVDTARAAWEARQRALGLDANLDPQIAAARQDVLQNRAAQAGLIGTLAGRAQMVGPSAAQWASQAGMNRLANEVASQAANDPRMAIRGLAAGGAVLARAGAQGQAQEGLARQAALQGQVGGVRGVDLQQAARENQLLADQIRWQNAKALAAERWADAALRSRGVDLGAETAILRGGAGGGGIDWRDVTSGIVGGVGAGLATYASMGGGRQAAGAAPGGDPLSYQPSGGFTPDQSESATAAAVKSALYGKI